jgi:FtsH-binding integral membrane protein
MAFVRKVFGILTVQLAITAAVAGACYAKRNDPKFVKMMANPAVLLGALAGFLACFCALVCCQLDKQVPTNYLLLLGFTLCQSVMVGHAVMAVPEPSVVLGATCMTLGAVVGIMLYATFANTDFTMCGPLLNDLFFIFAITSLFVVLFGPKLHFFIAAIGVFLFSVYLIYDTQLLMSGTFKGHRKYQIDEDSYIMASVVLYLDIINLFLYILELMNQRK